jgi:hypothetical protein
VLAPLIAQRLRLPEDVDAGYFADGAAGPAWVAFRRRLDSWGRVCGTTAREDAVRLAGDAFDVVRARLAEALPPLPDHPDGDRPGATGDSEREGTS